MKLMKKFAASALSVLAAVIAVNAQALPAAEDIPEGYVQLEYLKGDGLAYIDLGVPFTQDDTVVFETEIPEITHMMIYGSRTGFDKYDAHICGVNPDRVEGFNMDFCHADDSRLNIPVTDCPALIGHHLVVTNGAAFRSVYDRDANRTYEQTTVIDRAFKTPGNIYLFESSVNSWSKKKFTGKIFSFTVFRNGDAWMRLVPCLRTSDGQLGFLDLASEDKRFHTNAGTGFFAAEFDNASFDVAPIGSCRPLPDGVLPPLHVTDKKTGALLVKDVDYTALRVGAAVPGQKASVCVCGKGAHSGIIIATFDVVNVVLVDSKAQGTADGTSWENAFTSLTDAIPSGSVAGTEIWVATNHVPSAAYQTTKLTISNGLTIRGGFVGNELRADERPAGLVSKWDGRHERGGLWVGLTGTLLFERFQFTRCTGRALKCENSGTGVVDCRDCIFSQNGYEDPRDDGFCILMGEPGEIRLTRCLLEDNVLKKQDTKTAMCGIIKSSTSSKKGINNLLMTDCVIRRNGLAAADVETASNQTVSWALVDFSLSGVGSSIKAIGCRFEDNHVRGPKGFIYSPGYIVFSNCVWTGNEEYGAPTAETGGIRASAKGSSSVVVENCTFGYNVSCSTTGSAIFNLVTSNLRVKNSIFYGNVTPSGASASPDVWLADAVSTADIDWTLMSDVVSNRVKGVAGSAIVPRENNIVGDPRFVTTRKEFDTIVNGTSSGFVHSDPAAIAAINCHLRGGEYVDEESGEKLKFPRRSPAIDAGDPSREYGLEPEPNGKRLNLGAYGNTPWATTTPPPGLMLLLK